MQFSKQNSCIQFLDVALADLPEVARKILEAQKCAVNVLDAPMGSGKTTLCAELVKAWGSEDAGSSPTFALIEEHSGPQGTLYHVDAYRIEDEDEAYGLGFEEYVDESCPVWIEWAERVQSFLPYTVGRVVITAQDNSLRNILFYPEVTAAEIPWNHE
ncbi:MAG: tRNA threonylcarbamoyladenosine biosynthesis protein TsaE [Cryomorphaceae bacterium]|jgi:tRNA threonylcarbamoyladenosine biosynthesis protein TsaE|nr:MAG: tRNA threonylcarbamoyladenosine biosynthesis protein TsaE [Cryomorphaceae bacterium]